MDYHSGKACKHVSEQIVKKIKLFKAGPYTNRCKQHPEQQGPVCVCLHCAQILCSVSINNDCINKHQQIQTNHVFTMQIEPFSIWCAMCKDSLWNLAFDYADSCKDKDYLLMKEFELAVRHYVYESGRKVNVDKNDNNQQNLYIPKGIINFGNTCYLSVIMQAISATDSLVQLYKQYKFYVDGWRPRLSYNIKTISVQIDAFYSRIILQAEERKTQEEEWHTVTSKKDRGKKAQMTQSVSRIKPMKEIKSCILNQLFKLTLQNLHNNERNPCNLSQMFAKLFEIQPKYRENKQQDAQQLLLLLISSLSQGQKIQLITKAQRYEMLQNILGPQKITPIQNIFGCYLVNETFCMNCKQASYVFDLIYDIPVSIDTVEQKDINVEKYGLENVEYYERLKYPEQTKIHSLLLGFFKHQILTSSLNDFKCQHCQSKTGQRRYFIASQPKVLIVSIKRFNSRMEKISRHVGYPGKLDLSGVCVTKGSTKYLLYAVIVHEGNTLSKGHYICFIKCGTKKWFKCSDESVEEVSQDTVRNQKAYMLFYKCSQ